MTTGSTHNAADRVKDDVPALIQEGLAATGILPPYERLVELDRRLRAVIEDRLPAAQAAADALDRGTSDWYARQTAIDYARQALSSNMGPGLRSAALHVSELARRCAVLEDSP